MIKSNYSNIHFYGIAKEVPVICNAFKTEHSQTILTLPGEKPDIKKINSVSSSANVRKKYFFKSPGGISCEGQMLSGQNLSVKSKINHQVEYIASDSESQIHLANHAVFFSSCIVLGKDDNPKSEYRLSSYIEDMFVYQIDCRKIYMDIFLVITAVPVPYTLKSGVI